MGIQRNVFVTGANGYIGSAVCRAFVRAGWRVFGMVRRPEAAAELASDEIIPVMGTLTEDPAAFAARLHAHPVHGEAAKALHAIVGCTEDMNDYATHYGHVAALMRALAKTSNEVAGVRPLVLWSSGCKDYGTHGRVDGTPGLRPYVETDPLDTIDLLRPRTEYSLRAITDHADLFDAAVLRPTNVYGYSSSYYGCMFDLAEKLAASKNTFEVAVDPRSIMHGMHVDDCGEAYVALAEHADRTAVAGQCFNISASRYETAGVVAAALEREYGLEPNAIRFVDAAASTDASDEARRNAGGLVGLTFGFSQWVGSDKLRDLTGWRDRRPAFTDNMGVYRMAFEAAAGKGHGDVARIRERSGTFEGRVGDGKK